MSQRYALAPQAARDIVAIWRYVVKESSYETADKVESAIREQFVYLAEFPYAGHRRPDLTGAEVRFVSVYSYLIVYRAETKPVQTVAVLHGRRDLGKLLKRRLWS